MIIDFANKGNGGGGSSASSKSLKPIESLPSKAVVGEAVALEDGGIYQYNGLILGDVTGYNGSSNVYRKYFNNDSSLALKLGDNFALYAAKKYDSKDDYDSDNSNGITYGFYVGTDVDASQATYQVSNYYWDEEGDLPMWINKNIFFDANSDGILYSGTWKGEICFGSGWSTPIDYSDDWQEYEQNGTTIRFKWNDDSKESFQVELVNGTKTDREDWQDKIETINAQNIYHSWVSFGGSEEYWTSDSYTDEDLADSPVFDTEIEVNVTGSPYAYTAKLRLNIEFTEIQGEYYCVYFVSNMDITSVNTDMQRFCIYHVRGNNANWYGSNVEITADWRESVKSTNNSINNIIKLTQEEYDAIEEKDEYTFYIIVEE